MHDWKCRSCGRKETDPDQPECCGDPMKKDYSSVRFGPVMHEHRSVATGTVVSDRRHIKNGLREMSEKQTERTGIPHSYVEVDLADRDTLKVTDEV
jgi:hypothetical protein